MESEMKRANLTLMEKALHFGWHQKHCANCRYFRISKTGAFTSDCLFLGRMLGLSNARGDLVPWAARRVCDAWKRRPKKWDIYSEGSSPFWKDPYIPRETQIRVNRRIGRKFRIGRYGKRRKGDSP